MLRKTAADSPLLLFLGGSAGLAISGFLVFSSLVIFGKLEAGYLIAVHLVLLAILITLHQCILPVKERHPLAGWERSDILALVLLAAGCIPVVIQANFYPYGGWDAWSCWNLKARFIFLGGTEWKNMFDPVLWRSNTAYPFLLPAVNAWVWSFGKEAVNTVPLAVSCLITFLTAGTLLFAVKKLTGRLYAVLAPLWLLSNIFIVTLAASQYSDLMVGNFFLASVVAWISFIRTRSQGWLAVLAVMLGAMAFTKSEGLALAIITASLIFLFLTLLRGDSRKKNDLLALGTALAISFIPAAVFQLGYAPDSHTFINGLISDVKPTSLERLQAVFVFLGMELISTKWNGLWLIALAGLILSGRKAWRRELLLIPAAIILYLGAVSGVYWLNTFFDIAWWLGSTLNRILYALIPALILWVFLAFE
jgi:hypothetical protein